MTRAYGYLFDRTPTANRIEWVENICKDSGILFLNYMELSNVDSLTNHIKGINNDNNRHVYFIHNSNYSFQDLSDFYVRNGINCPEINILFFLYSGERLNYASNNQIEIIRSDFPYVEPSYRQEILERIVKFKNDSSNERSTQKDINYDPYEDLSKIYYWIEAYLIVTGNVNGCAKMPQTDQVLQFQEGFLNSLNQTISKHSWADILKKLPKLQYCKAYKELWHKVSSSQPLNVLNDDMINLMKDAHNQFITMNNISEVDKYRNNLNHNRIKNDFVLRIGNVRTDLSIPERGSTMLAAWRFIRENGCLPVENDDAFLTAFAEWARIENDVKCLFKQVPDKFGLSLSFKGLSALKELIDDKTSSLNIVSRFVDEFQGIAFFEEAAQYNRLSSFFAAIDKLQNTLSDMRHIWDSDKILSDYFVIAESKR